MNLKDMSTSELKELIARAEKTISKREIEGITEMVERLNSALDEVNKIATELADHIEYNSDLTENDEFSWNSENLDFLKYAKAKLGERYGYENYLEIE